MRDIVSIGFIFTFGLGVAGCADPNTKATHIEFGKTIDTVTTGPALRLVSERWRALPDGQVLPTMCSEPSPDVAIAFGRTLAVQGSYAETGAPTVSGSVNAASTEAATALAGRTAGVLALRDGLYAACQSYVNGVVGHDAYAMILSQYGNLLVAMAGTGTGGNPTPYTPKEAAITAMLVACISEHDPTRIRPIKASGKADVNPLLSERDCKALLLGVGRGHLLDATPKGKATTDKKKETKVGPGEKITTTASTVTEKNGPPLPAK